MTIYNTTVHGTAKFYEQDAIVLSVPDISSYVGIYPLVRNGKLDMSGFPIGFIDNCPKKNDNMASCDDNHQTFEAKVELLRGALMPPTKSGKRAGQARDPQFDNNYYWTFERFIEVLAPNTPQVAQKPVIGASVTPNSSLTEGELVTIRREMATNDRTAIMQSASYFMNEPIEGVILGAEKLANWLNARTCIRHTSKQFGEANQSESPVEVAQPISDNVPTIKNREDMHKAITASGFTAEQCLQALDKMGYENSSDFLSKNPDDFEGMFNQISVVLNSTPKEEEIW